MERKRTVLFSSTTISAALKAVDLIIQFAVREIQLVNHVLHFPSWTDSAIRSSFLRVVHSRMLGIVDARSAIVDNLTLFVVEVERQGPRIPVQLVAVVDRLLDGTDSLEEGDSVGVAAGPVALLIATAEQTERESAESALVRELDHSHRQLDPVVDVLVEQCSLMLTEYDRASRVLVGAWIGFVEAGEVVCRQDVRDGGIGRGIVIAVVLALAFPHHVEGSEVLTALNQRDRVIRFREKLARGRATLGANNTRRRMQGIDFQLEETDELSEIPKSLQRESSAEEPFFVVLIGKCSHVDVKPTCRVHRDLEFLERAQHTLYLLERVVLRVPLKPHRWRVDLHRAETPGIDLVIRFI